MDERARDYYYSKDAKRESSKKGSSSRSAVKLITAGQFTEQRAVLIMGNETRLREKRACETTYITTSIQTKFRFDVPILHVLLQYSHSIQAFHAMYRQGISSRREKNKKQKSTGELDDSDGNVGKTAQ